MNEDQRSKKRGDLPVREDIAPRRDITPRKDIAPRRDLAKGSRPPPQNRPSTSSLSVLFVMLLVIVAAFVSSGNIAPVDPNGPGGPPTLAPYYNPADYPKQHIVTPTGGFGNGKKNLQLETFNVDNCGDNSAMLFVIDTSGSMQFDGKIQNEKKALTYFTGNMGGLSAIGINDFGDIAKQDLPLNYYKDVKPQVKQVINDLDAHGYTKTRDAMQMAYDELKQSIDNEDYPGYKYNLVLLTDGVPEVPPPRSCYVQFADPNTAPLMRCFAAEQDPTVPTNIPDQIRNLGVDIYVINVYSPSYHSDAEMFPYLNTLLKKVASQPTNTHYYVSINGSNLSQVLQTINSSICYGNLDGTQP
ncbi:MAG TPA: vWA domain-containing protein [Candidatus Saccharimonadales bacterium]|nr:vWA domain-containing protein [Candidatus Saccharimonadales bacterium]